MAAFVKVGGVWKEVTNIYTKVGGVWKEVENGYTKVAGVWKQFHQNLFLVGGSRGDSTDNDATSNSVGMRFNRDGTVDRRNTGTFAFHSNWMSGGSVPSTVGDDFEIQVTWVSGDTALQPTLADGVYRALSSNRTYDKTGVAPGLASGSLSYTIREIADTGNFVTGTWTVSTSDPD